MQAELGPAAELRDDHGLLHGEGPPHPVALVAVAVVPADILVETDDVGILQQFVVDRQRGFVQVLLLHRGADQARAVQLAGLGDELAQELQTGRQAGRLVGHGPDDHVRAVAVADDHVRELVLCIGVGRGILPLDGPVDGNLIPDQQAHLLGGAHHRLVVRVMRQAHEVAAQLLGPSEQDAGIRLAVGPAAGRGRDFLVDRDALAEDGLPVQQDARPLRLDGPEADPVPDFVGLRGDPHVIELRIGRAPALRLRRHAEGGLAGGVGRHRLVDAQLVDVQRDPLGRRRAVQLDPALDAAPVLGQLDAVFPDEGLGDGDQVDVARDPAVVPPVGIDSRDPFEHPLVVHLHDHGVLAGADLVRDLDVEGRVSAQVLGDGMAVQAHDRLVVGCPEIQEGPSPGPGRGLELLPVPDRPLIEVQLRALGVPVAGDPQFGRRVEVVFDQLGPVGVETPVGEEGLGVRHRVAAVIVIPRLILVDESLPVAVQGHLLPAADILDLGGEPETAVVRRRDGIRLLRTGDAQDEQAGKGQIDDSFHDSMVLIKG